MTITNIVAQNKNITKLKEEGRDSIIQYSIIKLKEKNITNIPTDPQKIRVLANNKEIYILYNMEFYWDNFEKSIKNFDLKVYFTEDAVSISPYDYSTNLNAYKLTTKQKKITTIVMDKMLCPFAEDERINIKEEEKYYEMICSRGFDKGAECYHIDKKSGEKSMIWHETPYPDKDNIIVNPYGEFIEIK